MNKHRKPSWHLLDLLVLLSTLLLLGQTRLRLTAGERTLLLVLIVFGTYGLMALWVYANQAALDWEEREKKRQERLAQTYRGAPPPVDPLPTPTQRHFRQVMRSHAKSKKEHIA